MNQEAGADEQHDRERNLDDDQHLSWSVVRGVQHAAAHSTQHVAVAAASHLKRRRHAEQHAGRVDRIELPSGRAMASRSSAVFEELLGRLRRAPGIESVGATLYGLIAYNVQQRTRELGLRLALGVTPRETIHLVLTSGLKLTGLGIGIGAVAAVLLTRLLSSMLFGVGAFDITTFVGVPVSLCAIAALACYLPARRVYRIEPLKALSGE